MTNAAAEKAIFQAALFIADPAQRAEYLDVSCQDNAEMRRRVESLLAASEDENFMRGQAMDSVLESPERDVVYRTCPGLGEQPGDQVGNYKLLQRIGEGGFGVVYMAEQQEPIRRCVALKIIKLGMDTKQVIGRFEAERQALAMMDHPNIAKVFDAGSTESGRPYFVMELVRGVAITQYCDENDLTNAERLELFVGVCRAIQHAHQKGIIHRDVKPNNVMITMHDDRPVPKVIDFGIAKATEHRLTERTLFTEYAQLVGTPAYMSPEQAQLSGLGIDTRSDIYSLGVLLYELLVGKPPFDPEELRTCGYDEICRRIREVEPPVPSTRLSTLTGVQLSSVAARRRTDPGRLTKQVRGDLDWIVMKALEKDRRRRYDTATALADDVQRFLQEEPVLAVRPSAAYKFRKFARRNRGAIAAMTFVAASLILATMVSTWQAVRAMRAEREQSRLVLVAERARGAAARKGKIAEDAAKRAEAGELRARELAYASDMYGADQALSLNNLGLARRLLVRNRPSSETGDFRNWEWRSVWLRCREGAVSVFGDREQPIYSMSVSRDGKRLATGELSGQIRVWDVSSGKLMKTLSPKTPKQFGLVAFAPGGDHLYATAAVGVVKTWSLPSFAETKMQLRHGSGIRAIRLSDDGKLLAIFGFDEMITLWDLDSVKPTRLYGGNAGGETGGALAISRDKQWLAIGLHENIRIVDLATLDEVVRFPTTMKGLSVRTLAFSPNGQVLASGTQFTDGSVDLWRASDGTLIDRLKGHTAYIFDVAYSPDGRQLASCSADQTIRLWDMDTRKEHAVLRGHENEVWAIDFAADGRHLVSGDKNGIIRVWDAHDGGTNEWPIALVDKMPTGLYGLYSQLSFSSDGHWVATRNRDDTISLRSAELLEETHRLTGLGKNNRGVRFAPRENLLAVGNAAGCLTLLDPEQPQGMVRVQLSQSAEIFPTGFSRDGKRLLVIARDTTQSRCVVCTVANDQEPHSWSIPSDEQCAALSPDGHLVVTGHADGTARFWKVADPGGPFVVQYRQRIESVAFSPDGRLLVTGIGIGEADIWDVATRSSLGRLRGHMQGLHAVQFSPDGKRVATAGSSGESVKLWDVATQQELATLIAAGFSFRQVEFSPDGNAILTVDATGALHLWRVPSCGEIDTTEKGQNAKNANSSK